MARKNQLDPTAYNAMTGFDGDWRDSWWNQDYLEMTARRLNLANVRTVLDLGCGVGHWGVRLLDLCHADASLIGVDREPTFLDRARTRAADRHASFEELHGEELVERFGKDAFDLVTCQTVLMHTEDASAVLEQMCAVVKPGGLLLVAEPDNLSNTLSSVAVGQRDPQTLLAAAELHMVSNEGKRVMGHGDNDLGVRLPELFHAAGLTEIECRTNDRCAFLVPPYDHPLQKLELEHTHREDPEVHRALFQTRFLAGGGDPERFPALWAAFWSLHADRVEAIKAGHYINAGGFVMYLASGRKPVG
ncbi:MAG: class I SAM-dependent methyltransferase [Myxococcota bacterium]